MRNFIISAVLDMIFILISYFIFKNVINGPTRHKLYEKLMSSFAKFVIYIFIASVLINSIAAYILYKTGYVMYINIINPALVSVLVGFIVSTVPTRGIGDKKDISK